MDTELFDFIGQHFPQFNPLVCNGLAVAHMEQGEAYIDRIFKCAAQGFPQGLMYHGYMRCTPTEEYNVITAKRNNKGKSIEITRSDLYLVKYIFSYQGEELKPQYLYMPFVSNGGMIKILGSTFNISPVLADRAISVGVDSIFIPLNRDKLTFKRLIHHMLVDGVRETTYVVWSNIHHPSKRRGRDMLVRKQVDMNATPVHYLFCKYGVTRTFGEFGAAEVVIGKDDITPEKYPPSEWRICSSTGIKPRGVKGRVYTPSQIRLAIRKDHYNLMTSSMIGAFFYVVDHFPGSVDPEYVDEKEMWMVLMGHIALEPNTSEGKMLIGIESHMSSLDGYIDGMVKEMLREDGVLVNDIYDLFAHIIETMPERVAQSGINVASMYGKKLTVLRYVFADIIVAIFKMMFDLQKKSKKGTKILSKKEVLETMQKHLKPELIVRLNRNHAEVSNISSPSDNMLFKITSNLVLQTNSAGPRRQKARTTFIDPSKSFHASIAEVGSINNLPKSEPTGRSRLNPFVQVSPDGSIQRDPKKRELMDRIQESIQR